MNQYLVNKDGFSKQVSGVIFDCDGVMVNSREANAEFFNRILKILGLAPLTVEQEAYSFMATVDQVLKSIIPAQYQASLPKICKEDVNYIRDIMPLITLEEGFVDFLDFLSGKNIRCAVHTNRFDSMETVINMFNLQKYFDPVVTTALVKPKPAPDGIYYILDKWQMPKEQVIFIGDSLTDAQASAGAGVFFVAYCGEKLQSKTHVQSYKNLTEMFVDESALL